jgi:hypothetical protein
MSLIISERDVCPECGVKYRDGEHHSCVRNLRAMIDDLRAKKMDRFHVQSGLKFPNMEELIRM